VLVAIAGCGRLGFDALSDANDGAAGPDAPSDLVLWLRMEETDATKGIKDSARGHVVMCDGACPMSAPGRIGNGFHFTAERLLVLFTSDLSGGSFTAAVWMNPDSIPTTNTDYRAAFCEPLGPAGNDADSFALSLDKTQQVYNYTCNPVDGCTNYYSGAAMMVGAWHHVAVTWDAGTHDSRFYYDGAHILGNDATRDVQFDSSGISVGADNINKMYFWQGVLDDVRLYDRALDDMEISNLFAGLPVQ
jgi:hypothetical protein